MNRQIAPETHAIDSIPLILPKVRKTKSGIPIYIIDETNDDALKITLQFAAGKIRQVKSLVASFTLDLLLSGTAQKTAQEIEESIDSIGGYTEAEMGMEQASFTVFSLTKNANSILKLALEAISNVNFNQQEFENYRRRHKQHFQVNLEKVATRARRNFLNSLYKFSVYGDMSELEDYDNIEAQDCQKFYNQFIRKGLLHVSIVGNVDETTLTTIIENLDDWKNENLLIPEEITPKKPEILHEAKQGAVQSAIRIGKILFTPHHPDYMEFKVLNTILGGYFGSRLMANIREDKGYTYGIGSGSVAMTKTGYFFISTEVAVDVKEQTLTEVKKEITRLQTELVSQEELELVQKYLSGQFLKNADGAFAMMDQFLFLEIFGLDVSFFEAYLKKINSITPERIKELAIKHIQWEDLSVITVG
jgi:predicted Zn-dependent peptidase